MEDVPDLRIIDDVLWLAVQDRLETVRASDRSKKIRRSEFWKDRRPRHLLTGLVYCGECGGAMASIGKDYLACQNARSGAGCTNRKGIRRTRIEEAVLDGLKSRLMRAEYVAEFITAFHEEMNTARRMAESGRQRVQSELRRVSAKLDGLYDAIADGLRTSGLKKKLLELERQKTELEHKLSAVPASEPYLHPNLAALYNEKIDALREALSKPETRTEAAEILRGLIEGIKVKHTDSGPIAEIVGDIVQLVTLSEDRGVPPSFESSVKVVAGARNHRELTIHVAI